MTTSSTGKIQDVHSTTVQLHTTSSFGVGLWRRSWVRELLIFLGFCLMTVVMTWPWVLHLRDAIADRGDPYMIAWTLWSDYHRTFHDPLHLFDANVFYPYRYTLAFSEHDYGIAILFFPLFALGIKTLTIHSIATFLGFAFSGYGVFRLARTLSGSVGVAWIAGIIFAFIPFRFHVLSHLHYLFAGWIPLVLEALVLFVMRPSWRRASWLGTAFLMNGLTCVSWLILTSIPLALVTVLLVSNNRALLRQREFLFRGFVALAIATAALVPFLIPYYVVTVKYGLHWEPWEFALNSPSLIHWLVADPRNKVWHNLGAQIPGGHKLFPGLLAPLLALAALRIRSEPRARGLSGPERRLAFIFEVVAVLAAIIAVLALGYGDVTYRVFGHQIIRLGQRSVDQALLVLVLALGARFWLYWRSRSRPKPIDYEPNGETSDSVTKRLPKLYAIEVALIWTIWGFLSSLGANFFINRLLHDYVLPFQSLRIPSRSAMICYVGLSVLGGIGAAQVANLAKRYFTQRNARTIVLVVIGGALLFELHASPLNLEKGEVNPSELALRLKNTPMKGGLVELPSDPSFHRDFYMLRAADHGRPLVNATSSFISPLTDKINVATRGPIADNFIELLEKIPTSYLVIHNGRLTDEQRPDFDNFISRQIVAGRLRFIKRFDDSSDLYAVVKNEPQTRAEGELPLHLSVRYWSNEIRDNPERLLGSPLNLSERLYRVYLASRGTLPRYQEFKMDLEKICQGIVVGSDGTEDQFQSHLREFLEEWTNRPGFEQTFGRFGPSEYIDLLIRNAGVRMEDETRQQLIKAFSEGHETRASILLKIVDDPGFVEKEKYRSVVLLNYFGYLRRNPNDPPDSNLKGFEYWVEILKKTNRPDLVENAFKESIEYRTFSK